MKHVQIVSFCDGEIHDEQHHHPSTVERTVSIDGSKPILLDLCDECDGTILAVLALMERGAQIDLPAAKKPTPKATTTPTPASLSTVCPEPDCGQVSKTRSALGQHVRTQHGKGLKDYAQSA